MTLRNNGYGIGAVAYFRRIAEGMTNDLLDRLAVAMEESGDPKDQIESIRELKEGKASFDVKMGGGRQKPCRHTFAPVEQTRCKPFSRSSAEASIAGRMPNAAI